MTILFATQKKRKKKEPLTTVFFNGSKLRFATFIRMSDYFNPFILYQTMSFSIYFHTYFFLKSLGSLTDRPNIHEHFPPVNIWHLVCRLVGLQFPGMIHIYNMCGVYIILKKLMRNLLFMEFDTYLACTSSIRRKCWMRRETEH